jgi:class 3 adenylate cyclase
MEFTVIGDTINTASRFSGLAQGRQILATRSARDRLGLGFDLQQLPSNKVKGKAEEVEVFEVKYCPGKARGREGFPTADSRRLKEMTG